MRENEIQENTFTPVMRKLGDNPNNETQTGTACHSNQPWKPHERDPFPQCSLVAPELLALSSVQTSWSVTNTSQLVLA